MGNNTRLRDMAASFIGSDIPGVADIHICGDATSTQTPYQYWNQWARGDKDCFHTTINLAYAACVSGRNDVVMITPDNHTLAASLAMNKNMTHLVGMYPTAMMNQRSRIGHSVTMDPLINITGYGNILKNIYTMYGGAATDLTVVAITGNRNTFKHCHFHCHHATPMDEATFKLLHITETSGGDGLEHYFDHVTLGNQTVAWTDGEAVKYSGTPRMVFEDCMFLMSPDGAGVTYFDGTAGDGAGFIIFKSCGFLNTATANTVAIGSTGLAATTIMVCDMNTWFYNSTDLIAAANESQLRFQNTISVADELIGMTTAYDHTA